MQHQNAPLLPGIEHRMDPVAHLGGGPHALDQDIAVPVAGIRADLMHQHRHHLLKTDHHDMIFKRIGNLALAVAFDPPLQHVRHHRDQQAAEEQQSQNGNPQRKPAQFGLNVGHAARVDKQTDQLQQAAHRRLSPIGVQRFGNGGARRLRKGKKPANQIDHPEEEQQNADQPGKLRPSAPREGPVETQRKETSERVHEEVVLIPAGDS